MHFINPTASRHHVCKVTKAPIETVSIMLQKWACLWGAGWAPRHTHMWPTWANEQKSIAHPVVLCSARSQSYKCIRAVLVFLVCAWRSKDAIGKLSHTLLCLNEDVHWLSSCRMHHCFPPPRLASALSLCFSALPSLGLIRNDTCSGFHHDAI